MIKTWMRRALGLGAVAWITWAGAALAHEVRPALLQISERPGGGYDASWKQPVMGDMAVRLIPHLSGGGLDKPPDRESSAPGFRIRTWEVRSGPPLNGQQIRIEGLAQTVTDVLVRVTTTDGRVVNAVLKPGAPTLTLDLSGPRGLAVPAYLTLGVEHILTGPDHLMFVLGLLLIIGPSWRVVKAVTAFTVAHSLTLALAALGLIHVPSAVIEALVALSIVFVACELAAPADRPPTLTKREPWLIAFTFGLLHGLAFAGALAEVGLPQKAAPQALFLFNVGVEIGQLMFIGAALTVMAAWRRWAPPLGMRGRRLAEAAPAYVIGGFAAYWFIERMTAAFA